MSFIWTVIIGLVAGILAKLIMPGKDPGGIIITILLGIGGALLATFLGTLVGVYGSDGSDGSAGLIGAVVGAVIILGIYRLIKKKR